MQLEQTIQRMNEKEQTIEILEGQLKQMLPLSNEGAKGDSQEYTDVTDINLTWRNGNPALQGMYRECNAAVDKTTVYFNIDSGTRVYCYNSKNDLWTHVPECQNQCSSFVFVDGLLTSIGGVDTEALHDMQFSRSRSNEKGSQLSNKLYSLKERRWIENFPPMLMERASATAVSTDSSLIVVGGKINWARHYYESVYRCHVEVMNITTQQWSVASSVPSNSDLHCASGVICGDQLYVLGAKDSNRAYSCSLTDLLQSTTMRVSENIWRRIADIPVLGSTCVSFYGHLLAIGGEEIDMRTRRRHTKHDSDNCGSTAVYAYNPTTKSWEVNSQLSVARYNCFAVALPTTNELMVVDGKDAMYGPGIDSVEFASMI